MPRLSLVNPLQGTRSHFGFSQGNTLPLIARPFGMNHWSPQTAEGRWFFHADHRKLQGIRCTHQPSPWIGDYGAFVVMPQTGEERKLTPEKRASAFRLEDSTLTPAGFRTELLADGTIIEMTPTERGAVFRFTFPEGVPARIILEPCAGEGSMHLYNQRTVFGITKGNSGGAPATFRHHMVFTFDMPVETLRLFRENQALKGDKADGERIGAFAEWKSAPRTVVMRVATSFVSVEQAIVNLEREVDSRSFESVLAESERAWEEVLGRIEIEGGTEAQQRTFTTCLWRTQLFPRMFHEINEMGDPIHYSPFDGQVHPGVLYTDNGFWDTYRTEYPLLALLDPVRLAEILQGWTNAAKEGGWFPQWASPGYRACMVGTHIDAVIADAICRGVTEFDVEAAYQAMRRHAFEVGDREGAWGRIGINEYLKFGYVTNRHHESVARSLDYAYDDWCLAQVARHLGNHEDEELFLARAQNYRHLYDPEVGFFRSRTLGGGWEESWSEFRWGSPYVEGGPWQSLWAVPHDIPGLMELMGGQDAFIARLEQMLSLPPRFETGVYGFEIHEMTEMAAAGFGQYAHSNQPVHHALWLFAAAGRPDLTEHWVRRVQNELYSEWVLPGDEDNGEMSAWYVLASIGIYPLCPGRPEWTRIPPLFDRVTVTTAAGVETVFTRDA